MRIKSDYKLKVFQLSILIILLCMAPVLGASTLDHDSLLNIIREYEDDSLKARAYIDFAEDIRDEYPDSAFVFLQVAEELAMNVNSNYLLSVIHNQEGLIYYQLNEYVDAMEQYFLAKKEIESIPDFRSDSASRMIYVQVLNQLGIMYFSINKFDEGLDFYKSLTDFMRENGMEASKAAYRNIYVRAYINIGAINIRTRSFDEAEINYTKAMTLLSDDDMATYAVILNNLGIIAKEQEDYQKAFENHKRALQIRIENEDLFGMCQSYNNLGATYYVSGNMGEAKSNFEKSQEISIDNAYLSSALISLGYLQWIHEARGEYRMAFDYQSQQVEIKDSLMNQEKLRSITQMEMQDKFDTRVREALFRQEKLEAEQKRKETIYFFITASSLLGILILILFYFLQRSKMRRNTLESRQNNLEMKSLELEKVNLEQELEFRTKELATNVMYMARTSEFISNISEKLLKSKMHFTRDNQEVILKIITELQTYIDQDTWSEFEIRFQQVHNEFYTRLNELHPDLTANEKKLCAFLRLNMTTKEISAITYQSVNSIIVARSRLRKKLGIERDENLVSYLENL